MAAASKPKPKSSSGLWLGLAAVALLLVGVGLFMSGAFNASGPGEPPAPLAGPVASVPAPAPVASAPEVVSAPAVAVAASESVSPSPVPPEPTVVPVVALVEAAPVASPVALPVASGENPRQIRQPVWCVSNWWVAGARFLWTAKRRAPSRRCCRSGCRRVPMTLKSRTLPLKPSNGRSR